MGGIGSGRRRGTPAGRRPTTRQTTDQLPSLDVRSLKRKGLIAAGQEHANVLAYFRRRKQGPGPELVEILARLRLTWTPCNYGSDRPWFVCPGCDRRAAILYGTANPLLCRTCRGLAYPSQRRRRRRKSPEDEA